MSKDTHQEHMQIIEYLAKRDKPAIVITASGMCSGGYSLLMVKNWLLILACILFRGIRLMQTKII